MQRPPHRATNLVVTGTTLVFLLLAATMVTITFLMSPVIEEMFGESIETLLQPSVVCCVSVVTQISEINVSVEPEEWQNLNTNNTTMVWPAEELS